MEKIQREVLLKVFESVVPGLSPRETIAQSSCLVFRDGYVMTFNEEILCRRQSPLDITGAIKAKSLLELLSKLPDETIGVGVEDGTMKIRGSGKRADIRMESEVLLPVEDVESPDVWREVDKEFVEAVNLVHSCAGKNANEFVLTCVHIHPEYIEACDRFQIGRYEINTGVERPILVKADSIRTVVGFDMTEVSETKSWIHFRNPTGLVMSCRRHLDEYKQLDGFLSSEGMHQVVLPGALEEVISRAEIFSGENATANHVRVDLTSDYVAIFGEGASGRYEERKPAKYSDDPMSFIISPKLLLSVTSKSNECRVSSRKLHIDTGRFKYVTSTVVPEVASKG